MLESSAKREGGEGGWSRGSLSDEDFDRAALSLRPSWEVGLNAAPSADSLAPPRVEVLTTPFDPGKPTSAVVIEAAAPEILHELEALQRDPAWLPYFGVRGVRDQPLTDAPASTWNGSPIWLAQLKAISRGLN
jgi:hypothetical protein